MIDYTPIELNCEGVVERFLVQQVPRIGEQVTTVGIAGSIPSGVYKVIDVQHHLASKHGSQIIVYCEKTDGF